MAIKLIKDPATQVASCDVPGAKLDIDYTTNKVVLSSTDLNEHPQLLAASVAARQRFLKHSNSEGLV